jgi:lysophospholipase L1-like esterase
MHAYFPVRRIRAHLHLQLRSTMIITINDADVISLGGTTPRGGRLDVWRLMPLQSELDSTKLGSYSMRGDDVEIVVDQWPAGSALWLLPRAPGLVESWRVSDPGVASIGLADLVFTHAVNPETLLPLAPLPPSAQEVLTEAASARDGAVAAQGAAMAAASDAAASAATVPGAVLQAVREQVAPAVTGVVDAQVAPLVASAGGSASAASQFATAAETARAAAAAALAETIAKADAVPSEAELKNTYVQPAAVRHAVRSGAFGGLVIPPATAVIGDVEPSAWFAANHAAGASFTIHAPTRFSLARLRSKVASGNMEVAIYAVKRTNLFESSLLKVQTTGVTPVPASIDEGMISANFEDQPELPAGDYAVALWCDNTTATFIHSIGYGGKHLLYAAANMGPVGGGMPNTETAWPSGRAVAVTLVPAIPLSIGGAVLLGDSLTEGQSWFNIATHMRQGIFTLDDNAGIGGQKTYQLLARVQADVVAANPELVTVLGGTNDIGGGVDPSVIIANLDAIIAAILAGTTSNIILGEVPPRGFVGGDSPTPVGHAAIQQVNAWIRTKHGPRVKVAEWALPLSTGDGVTPNLDLFGDHVHPDRRGAQIMASVLAPLL